MLEYSPQHHSGTHVSPPRLPGLSQNQSSCHASIKAHRDRDRTTSDVTLGRAWPLRELKSHRVTWLVGVAAEPGVEPAGYGSGDCAPDSVLY